MKRIKTAFATILVLSMVTGCNTTTNRSFTNYNTGVFFYDHEYLVDDKTGVVYLVYGKGITVMLNQDGTPVTAKQLELETEETE